MVQGQPDVSLTADGKHAIVSTDFSGRVDGQRFGVTVIELNTPPQAPTQVRQIGIAGAGFTLGVQGPANFPIESEIVTNTVFTTFGNGIAVIDITIPEESKILDVIELPFNPISVDAEGTELYVVGNSPTPSLAIVDIRDIGSPIVSRIIDLAADGRPLGVSAGSMHVVVADVNLGILILERP